MSYVRSVASFLQLRSTYVRWGLLVYQSCGSSLSVHSILLDKGLHLSTPCGSHPLTVSDHRYPTPTWSGGRDLHGVLSSRKSGLLNHLHRLLLTRIWGNLQITRK